MRNNSDLEREFSLFARSINQDTEKKLIMPITMTHMFSMTLLSSNEKRRAASMEPKMLKAFVNKCLSVQNDVLSKRPGAVYMLSVGTKLFYS